MAAIKIMAVGGDRTVLVALSQVFQGAGHPFAAVADATRLLEAAAAFAPNLVLVFAQPSPVDAERRVAALRADRRFSAVRIALVTNQLPRPIRGVNHIVPEPTNPADFAVRIVRLLDPAGAAAMSAGAAVAQPGGSKGAAVAAPVAIPGAPPRSPAAARTAAVIVPPVSEVPEVEVLEEVVEAVEEVVEAVEEIVEEPVEELASVEEIQTFGARALIVDDDPTLVKLFSMALRRAGFDVLQGSDGQEGLQIAIEQRPDLVVADLNMPRLDGWGLLRAMRADHRVGEIPLVFLSAHDDYRENLKALAAGAQDYIAKGLKLDELVARLRQLLAPRDAFIEAIRSGDRVSAKLNEVGVQWALKTAAANRCSGTVLVRDDFWNVQVGLVEGCLAYAHAALGTHRLDGKAALPPLVGLRSGEFFFDPSVAPTRFNVRGEIAGLLEEAAGLNNQAEAQSLDRMLTQASRIQVDPQLYELYSRLGPPECRGIAAMVLQGMTPREIIARADRPPDEVEETLRDLLRRRVVVLAV